MLGLERVGKTYPNGVRALDGISLDVGPGEIVAVIGGSGCGKSTLLRAISGLDTPTQGRVMLDGADHHGAAREDRHHLPGAAAAAVAHGRRQCRLRPRGSAEGGARRSASRRALDRVGLTDKARRLAARTVRRTGAARRDRARAGAAAGGAAARRAVLGARCLHPRRPAGPPARSVGRLQADAGHGHP